MTSEEKQALLAKMMGMMKEANINMDHAQINMFVESGAKVVYQEVGSPAASSSDKPLTHEELTKAVMAVQSFMWGASAYAVLFCECRDHRGYPNVYTEFEKEVDEIALERGLSWRCRPGTISDAFSDNSYLKLNVEKWKDNGAKKRSLILLEKFQEELP